MSAMDSFFLQEWEVWRLYTAYFRDSLPPPDVMASRLVENDVVVCVRTGDGELVWKAGDKLETAVARVVPQEDGRYAFRINANSEIEPFVLECLYQASWFAASEEKVFGALGQFPAPYVRGFVGECQFESEGRQLTIYPVVKVYETGVVQVALRMIAPDRAVPLAEFLREYRNANVHRFDKVWAPTEFVKSVMKRDVWSGESMKRLSRRRRKRAQAAFSSLIDANENVLQAGDFRFSLAPLFCRGLTPALSRAGGAEFATTQSDEPGYTISDLVGTLIAGCAHALGSPAEMSGAKRKLTQGEYWVGKPHIYVTRCQDQRETAQENEKIHGPAFGCLLAGVGCDTDEQALSFLPESERSFQDFGWYMTREASLVVWSKSGLSRL